MRGTPVPIRFRYPEAIALLREVVEHADRASADPEWLAYVDRLTELCDEGIADTHIAFLGTELLAKTLNPSVDLYYVKPTKAPPEKLATSYSARPLCENVLVPVAADVGINIGSSGAQPLNNQPYFRMSYLGDGTPVHAGSQAAFNYMLELIKKLESMDQEQSRAALAAFVAVRREIAVEYATVSVGESLPSLSLGTAVAALVAEASEGGKRAQAAAAGLLDVFYSREVVSTGSGRINDPSRKRPGDICILSDQDDFDYEKAFEVKDKPVTATDIQLFVRNGFEKYRVADFGYLAMASNQQTLDNEALVGWAEERGASLAIYYNWADFIRELLFWAPEPTVKLTVRAAGTVAERLREIEASAEAVTRWAELVEGNEAPAASAATDDEEEGDGAPSEVHDDLFSRLGVGSHESRMVSCPQCGTQVRADRLAKHQAKIHRRR